MDMQAGLTLYWWQRLITLSSSRIRVYTEYNEQFNISANTITIYVIIRNNTLTNFSNAISVTKDWCNGHGSCYRNSGAIDDISCCCDPGMEVFTWYEIIHLHFWNPFSCIVKSETDYEDSKTCVQKPSNKKNEHGLYRQLVLFLRLLWLVFTKVLLYFSFWDILRAYCYLYVRIQ